MIKLPKEVIGRVQSLGEAGRCWLERLEDTVRVLEAKWGIAAGARLSGGDPRPGRLCGRAGRREVCPQGGRDGRPGARGLSQGGAHPGNSGRAWLCKAVRL